MPDMTPEVHHDRLMKEIDYEINTYGVASLADIIASLLSDRADTDDNSPKANHYRAAQTLYEHLGEQLARLDRPFTLPDHQDVLTAEHDPTRHAINEDDEHAG